MKNNCLTKKCTLILLILAMCLSVLAGCDSKEEKDDKNNSKNDTEQTGSQEEDKDSEMSDDKASTNRTSDDIVILFTNDVHCGIEENIGYAGLASYKKMMEEATPYVTLVDCGDAIQGDYIGMISQGEYLVDIMNEVGYDLAVLGNHEFDYGTEQLSKLIGKAKAQYLACNITYSGKNENALKDVKAYEIKEYGDVKVAFIGVATPETTTKSTPTYFMEDGEFVYHFAGGNGTELYDVVQKNIDECEEKGADYIILLTHLGDAIDESSPFTSTELVAKIEGVDVVLDAHSHSTVSCRILKDEAGEEVLVASTGTKLANIGKVVITENGTISTGLIDFYDYKDEKLSEFIGNIKAEYEEEMNKKVASSDIDLKCSNEEGIRLVRNRETAIGNLCADAYRIVGQADIGMVNGGGIRADIEAGDITYAEVVAVHPFGNTLCVAKVSGQEVADVLEIGAAYTKNVEAENGLAAGENGSFMSVSGLKFTIDTSIETSVVFDENGLLVEIPGERRVKDIMVLNKDGEYEPLEMDKEYTLASHNYLLKENGSGATFFDDNEFIIEEGMSDYQMLITYLSEHLQGNLAEKYSTVEGRITIK